MGKRPSAYNMCMKRELKGKKHRGKAAWRAAFKKAAKKCSRK